jgi:hypothetical protein
MKKLFLATFLLTSMTTFVLATESGGNGNGNGNGNIGSENGNNNGTGNVGNGSAGGGVPNNGPPDNGGNAGSRNRVETARNSGGCSGGDRNSDDRCCIYFRCNME